MSQYVESCYPRHHAAASLKRCIARTHAAEDGGYPRHHAAASLKPLKKISVRQRLHMTLSAASRRGLIEAPRSRCTRKRKHLCYPRHHAAASLKLRRAGRHAGYRGGYPRHHAAASLKQSSGSPSYLLMTVGYPRHHAAASLKLPSSCRRGQGCDQVIRGITPRPH